MATRETSVAFHSSMVNANFPKSMYFNWGAHYSSTTFAFSRMVTYLTVVITQQLYPSTLSHVQLLLIKNVLQTLVISEHGALGAIQILSPHLQGEHYCS
ncbi:hypothetical protein Tco_0924158 [Tanacetum coccineum]|uniref:Uncharacterized protein n=1 Tax=Tanacetum coccineum TaxID=301880 RepID=A0ABQ5D443_9ASTR